LLAEWNRQERCPARPTIERRLSYVADRFRLRRDIRFKTRITAAHWDEDASTR
jgi:cation diffusion facilitator CzcD-associated flavoprotein CzcO